MRNDNTSLASRAAAAALIALFTAGWIALTTFQTLAIIAYLGAWVGCRSGPTTVPVASAVAGSLVLEIIVSAVTATIRRRDTAPHFSERSLTVVRLGLLIPLAISLWYLGTIGLIWLAYAGPIFGVGIVVVTFLPVMGAFVILTWIARRARASNPHSRPGVGAVLFSTLVLLAGFALGAGALLGNCWMSTL